MEEPGGWDTFKMALASAWARSSTGSRACRLDPAVDEQELAAKFAGLPTKDEALKEAQAGNAPGVEMKGAADETAGEQGRRSTPRARKPSRRAGTTPAARWARTRSTPTRPRSS